MMENITGNYEFSVNKDTISEKPKNLKVQTPFGEVKQISSKKELSKFILEEKALIQSPKGKNFTFSQITALNKNLNEIRELFNKTFPPDEIEAEESSFPESALDTGQADQPLQVFEGRSDFYIGAYISIPLVQKGMQIFLQQTELNEGQIKLVHQPHMTIVPPASTITPSVSVKDVASKSEKIPQSFDVTFDKVAISKFGNISLLGKSDEYQDVAQLLATELNAEETNREPHCAIGKLSEEEVVKFFDNPPEGFSKDEIGAAIHNDCPPFSSTYYRLGKRNTLTINYC